MTGRNGGRLLRTIPGGCDDCNASTDLTDHGDGITHLVVRHDDTCPWFAAYQRRHA